MILDGKEYKFRLTMRSFIKVSKICPGGKLSNIAQVMGDESAESVEAIIKMAVILNEAYCNAERNKNPEIEVNQLTEDILLDMDLATMAELSQDILDAMNKGAKTEVDVDEPELPEGKKKEQIKETSEAA